MSTNCCARLMGTARMRPLRPEPPSPRLVLVIDGHEPPLRSGRLSSLRDLHIPYDPLEQEVPPPAVRRSPNARPTVTPSMHQVGQISHPGDGSRFDYASLEADRGLLFLAHLGASQVIEVDVHAHRVVRTINNLSQIHGVLVVSERRHAYATATGTKQMVACWPTTPSRIVVRRRRKR